MGETQIEREGAAQIEAAELSANDQNLPSNSLEIAPETREGFYLHIRHFTF